MMGYSQLTNLFEDKFYNRHMNEKLFFLLTHSDEIAAQIFFSQDLIVETETSLLSDKFKILNV